MTYMYKPILTAQKSKCKDQENTQKSILSYDACR